MDSSTTFQASAEMAKEQRKISPEFASWPTEGETLESINHIRAKFDELAASIESRVPADNGRYLALTKTKLEEACMFAVKAIAKR